MRIVSGATRSHALILECNAVAPETVREIAGLIERAGGRFLDAGIIGPPPRGKAKANLYVSGSGAAELEQLAGRQFVVQVVSDRFADAHALKVCYAALNKGTQALWLAVLIAAQRLDFLVLPKTGARSNCAGLLARLR